MRRNPWPFVAVALIAIVIPLVVGFGVVTLSGEAPPEGGEAVLVGAGDVALCSQDGDEGTAALLDQIPGTIFVAGDGGYPSGELEDYTECYGPSWGRFIGRTRPAPGNHDYRTDDAAGYFAYFGDRAGPPGRGYYSFDLGAWHIVSLNSNCDKEGVDCTADGDQVRWLVEDLRGHEDACVLAFWHHPLFAGGRHDGDGEVRPFWDALYEAGAEVVIAAHNHAYERFAPQDPSGNPDADRGIRQFVVGTGGGELYHEVQPAANREVHSSETHGVLKLTLGSTDYQWEFVPVAGGSFSDDGSDTCQ